jgi:RNA polymerase sigma-70 factor, ECF subfamily
MEIAMEASAPSARVEAVYREHGPRMWRSLRAFTGDEEVASDALAEAFAQVLRRGAAVRDPLPWVWRTAFRIAAGTMHEQRRQAISSVEPAFELIEPHYALLAALQQLPERQRAAVILHYYADRPVSHVASILGSTSPAVKVNLMRARRRLRLLLEREDE